MSILEQTLAALADDLRSRRVDVQPVGQTLNVAQGQGLMAHKANIDPVALVERLEATPAAGHRRLIAGFASGVKHVLMEPSRSRAADWTFVESTGGLVPNLEVDTFILGAEAASGESPWVLPFADDIVVAYLIELDRGLRVLTASQTKRWGVTRDRITSAARSILFHKTRTATPEPHEDFQLVQVIQVGDEYDAVRALVIADAFYSDIDESFRFSLPAQDLFYFVPSDSPDHLQALRQATDQTFTAATYPLSSRLFRFELGRPTPFDDEQHP
ncbi:MAG: hypothetical protein ACNA8W_02845 [Bradymonadaceae bacterium]